MKVVQFSTTIVIMSGTVCGFITKKKSQKFIDVFLWGIVTAAKPDKTFRSGFLSFKNNPLNY